MPFMTIRGAGKVKVTKRPKRIPKTVKIGNRKLKVDKSTFKTIWASNHLAKGERKRLKKRWKMG